MINTIKQNKKAVLAFLLALVMVFGIIPFLAPEAHAIEVEATSEGNEAFTGDFTLYLVNKDDPTKTETHTVTYDGTNWSTPKSDILPAHAFAYTGEVKDITYTDGKWNYTPVLQLDQSSAEKLAKADVMIATGEVAIDTSLELRFVHYFAKVTFNVTIATEFTPNAVVENLKVHSFDGISSFTAFADGDSYTAIIPPGTYKPNANFVAFKFISPDIRKIAYIPEEGLTLEAGKHYTFDLKVGKNKVTIEQISTNEINNPFGEGWNNETNLNEDFTGVMGLADAGKTNWENGDQVVATLNSSYYGNQTVPVTYDGTNWVLDSELNYLKEETPTLSAVYAPSDTAGLGEYIAANASIMEETVGDTTVKKLNVDFSNDARNYSRLRIVAEPNQALTVNVTSFTPAGMTESGEYTYTITADEKGNAYIYGSFAAGGVVTVKDADAKALKEYTFENATDEEQSYVLGISAVIDGTLGGKTTIATDDIDALVEQIKYYVNSGISTIIVTGEEPAMRTNNTAIGSAISRLSNDSSYNGTIDLILTDVTEIRSAEFLYAKALNSITLPKVTKLCSYAFENATYLRTITFGSVLTEVEDDAFRQTGKDLQGVKGSDLILNCGQMNTDESGLSIPNLSNGTWEEVRHPSMSMFDNSFNSIKLTHTGKCDECKAQ